MGDQLANQGQCGLCWAALCWGHLGFMTARRTIDHGDDDGENVDDEVDDDGDQDLVQEDDNSDDDDDDDGTCVTCCLWQHYRH